MTSQYTPPSKTYLYLLPPPHLHAIAYTSAQAEEHPLPAVASSNEVFQIHFAY